MYFSFSTSLCLPHRFEIIETTLPEAAGELARNGQPPGDAQLYGLKYLRGIANHRLANQGFGNQQMYVFAHDHVSNHGKPIANAHQLEDSKYQVAAHGI